MGITNQICDSIKRIRKEKNIKQIDIAEKIGLSQSAYAKIERGETSLDIERLLKISKVLSVDIEKLIPTVNKLDHDSKIESFAKRTDINNSSDYQRKYIRLLEEQLKVYQSLVLGKKE